MSDDPRTEAIRAVLSEAAGPGSVQHTYPDRNAAALAALASLIGDLDSAKLALRRIAETNANNGLSGDLGVALTLADARKIARAALVEAEA